MSESSAQPSSEGMWNIEPVAEEIPRGVPTSLVDTDPKPRGSQNGWQLVLLIALGAVYVLSTFVWISWAQYYSKVLEIQAAGVFSLDLLLNQLLVWGAPLAPALWFLSAYTLSKGNRTALLIASAVGAIVLLPWPMFFEAAPIAAAGAMSNG